jgi:hypothetical protein
MSQASSSPRSRHGVSRLLVVLALGLIVLWPADVSWLMDEPRLIGAAWHANHDGRIAVGGLYGNFGIRYGPLPTQIYQLLLLVTHDPITLVVLRSLLCAGATAVGLLWLARTLDLPRWFVAGLLVSPYVAAYQRVLWDASFTMPISALALAAFVDFLHTHRRWSLRLCTLLSVLLPTIHPQSLPLAVAVLGWLAWQHRAAWWEDRRLFLWLGVTFLVLNGFYIGQLAGQLFTRLTGSVQKGYPGGGSHLISALAPFRGGSLLSGADHLDGLARIVAPPWLHTAAQAGVLLFYPLAWLGIATAVREAWNAIRTRQQSGNAPWKPQPQQEFSLVLVAALIFQALLFGAMRIPSAPQYFFGTFALHAAIALLGVNALRKWRVSLPVGGLYVMASALLTLEAAISIHQHGYEKPLWPTLASSLRVARSLNEFSNTAVPTDVSVYRRAPQALRTLRLLLPDAGGSPHEDWHLFITRDLQQPEKPGETRLVGLMRGESAPAGSQPIEVTPLPKDWVPDPSTW